MPMTRLLRLPPVHLARLIIGVFILLELCVVWFGPDAKAAQRELAEALAKPDSTSRWEPEADLGIRYAALINLGVLSVLALTANLWTRPFTVVMEDDPLQREKPPLWQRLVLPTTMVLGFAGIYGATSFAGKSLWWDEMWAMKQCVHGTWKADKKNPEALKFQPTTWKRCAFYYQKPTNHPAISVAQKASLSVWRALTGAQPEAFSELAVRLPALIASGLAVLLLMRLIGAAQGMAIGGLLLLLHPWHLRYGVEARAYAFIVPLCLSGMLATRKVIFTRGRNVWAWVWLGLNQAVWIWNYPTSAIDVLVLFLILAVFLWRSEQTGRDKLTAMIRLIVTHAFAAALCLQLFLPNFNQARHWAGKEDQGHELDAGLTKDTLSYLTLGTNWRGAALTTPEGRGLTGVVDQLGSEPVAWTAVVLLLGLSLSGIIWAMRRQPRTGWLIASPLISSLLLSILIATAHSYFYPRFVIATLPAFVAGLALSGQVFSVWTQVQRRVVLAVMVVFAVLTTHPRGVLMTRPYSGFKEAAQLTQGWTKDHAIKPLVLCFGLGREVISVYQPEAKPAEGVAELTAARAKAKAEGRDLLVIQGYTNFHRARVPDAMALLDDRTQFMELGAFPGIEPDFLFRVLKAH